MENSTDKRIYKNDIEELLINAETSAGFYKNIMPEKLWKKMKLNEKIPTTKIVSALENYVFLREFKRKMSDIRYINTNSSIKRISKKSYDSIIQLNEKAEKNCEKAKKICRKVLIGRRILKKEVLDAYINENGQWGGIFGVDSYLKNHSKLYRPDNKKTDNENLYEFFRSDKYRSIEEAQSYRITKDKVYEVKRESGTHTDDLIEASIENYITKERNKVQEKLNTIDKQSITGYNSLDEEMDSLKKALSNDFNDARFPNSTKQQREEGKRMVQELVSLRKYAIQFERMKDILENSDLDFSSIGKISKQMAKELQEINERINILTIRIEDYKQELIEGKKTTKKGFFVNFLAGLGTRKYDQLPPAKNEYHKEDNSNKLSANKSDYQTKYETMKEGLQPKAWYNDLTNETGQRGKFFKPGKPLNKELGTISEITQSGILVELENGNKVTLPYSNYWDEKWCKPGQSVICSKVEMKNGIMYSMEEDKKLEEDKNLEEEK